MKFHLISLGLLSISSFLPFMPSFTPPASAACVMTDVGVQVAVHGSYNPADQNNNVTMQDLGHCMGSVTTNVGEQVYVGTGEIEQNRESNLTVGGDPTTPFGGLGPTIRVPVYVPVDVYAPAYDGSFYGNLPFSGSFSDPSYSANPGYPTNY
ncbi:MAG: hypothetical protein LH679_07635 [Cyanobacteria bacterium CAN_BIN43]|nr:hypothetical protein [Cyanobacteria bacterium CAN_BIN43]